MKKYILLIAVAFALAACKKETSGDDAPVVTFVSVGTVQNISGKDSIVNLVFKFKDANGDISYSKSEKNKAALLCDTTLKDLIVAYDEKIGNNYYQKKIWIPDNQHGCDTINVYQDSVFIFLDDYIPDISPSNISSPIEGLVTKKIDYITSLTFSSVGRFRFYIKDRAKHTSNIVTTPDFTFTP